MSFLPCELHCHTVHSDGDFTVRQLQTAAADNHLSLIALTDHNTTSGHDELDDDIIASIKGIEWTTYFGHMLVLGARGFVDWRDAKPDNIDEKIAQVKAQDGVVGIAHPYQIGSPVCTGGRWQFNVEDMSNIDYIEIWHEDLNRITIENTEPINMWTRLLDKGNKIACCYGRDWHRPTTQGHYGCTYIDIKGEINEKNALDGIKNGRTVVSSGAKFFFSLEGGGVKYSIGDSVQPDIYKVSFYTDLHSREKDSGEESVIYKTIKIISNGATTVLETKYNESHSVLSLEAGHWYRAELWGTVDGEAKPLAITSPIYCGY